MKIGSRVFLAKTFHFLSSASCLNLGLDGAGLSVGSRGLHVGVNRRGMYSSAGIPGTGLYAMQHFHSLGQPHTEIQELL